MTMTTTIVAVAIGLVPVPSNGQVAAISAADAHMIGRLTQKVDRQGNIHLAGFARQTGKNFELTVESDGDVRGFVGDFEVSFNARDVG